METINRQAKILVNGIFAGLLSEYSPGSTQRFIFQYDTNYLSTGCPIGRHFPLTEIPFESEGLHPFFDNLASEGWLRRMQCEQSELDDSDTFGLLLANGKSLIGAISIIPHLPNEKQRD